MQVFLAQARGKTRNGDLLRQSFDRMLRMRAMRAPAARRIRMDDALIDTLNAVTAALDQGGMPYAITGSVASGVFGEPVMSMDADLILAASPRQAETLGQRLSSRFYAPEDLLRQEAERGGFINIVDNRTAIKVDLSFVAEDKFLCSVLTRRVRERIGTDSPEFWFVTPEDVILMKLLWRRETQSTKQWDNALSVAQVRGARMDWKHLFDSARALGIEDDLIKLRDAAGI